MTWVAAARQVVATSSYTVVHPVTGEQVPFHHGPDDMPVPDGDEGMLLDLFTAGVLVTIHDALSPTSAAKFAGMTVPRAAEIAFTLASRFAA